MFIATFVAAALTMQAQTSRLLDIASLALPWRLTGGFFCAAWLRRSTLPRGTRAADQ